MVEKDVVKNVFRVVEVATQTSPVVVCGEEQFSVEQLLVKIANDLELLKKGLL